MRRSLVALALLAAGFAMSGNVQAQYATHGPDSGSTPAPMPKDIDPVSKNRLPLPKREDMDDESKKAYDKFIKDPADSVSHLQTPAGVRLYSPKVADDLEDVSQYLRNGTAMSHRLTEIAILVEAREMDDQYIWANHEPIAQRAGVEAAIIDIIKYGKPAADLGEKETAIITYGRELFRQKKVSPDTFAKIYRLFGSRGTVELASLMGVFNAISILDETVDVQLPDGKKAMLPAR